MPVLSISLPKLPREKVKISAEGGDYGSYGLGFNAQIGNEKFTNSLQANSASSEGYMFNTDYEIRNVFYQGKTEYQKRRCKSTGGFSEKEIRSQWFYASSAATKQYEETQASIVSVAHQQTFGKLKLNSNVYWRRGQDMYLYDRWNPDFYRNMHIGNNVGGRSEFQLSVGVGNNQELVLN